MVDKGVFLQYNYIIKISQIKEVLQKNFTYGKEFTVMEKIRVLVWNENYHEKTSEKVAAVYPNGIHNAIAAFLGEEEDIEVKTATLDCIGRVCSGVKPFFLCFVAKQVHPECAVLELFANCYD